jgi:hypothetical protein
MAAITFLAVALYGLNGKRRHSAARGVWGKFGAFSDDLLPASGSGVAHVFARNALSGARSSSLSSEACYLVRNRLWVTRVNIPDVFNAADKIKATWAANPTFTRGDITLASFTTAHATVTEADATIDAKRHELQGLLDKRDDDARKLHDLSTRALSGFRAVYGPDSPQYVQAGGTRRSERAPMKRAAKAGATA